MNLNTTPLVQSRHESALLREFRGTMRKDSEIVTEYAISSLNETSSLTTSGKWFPIF